MDNEKSSRAKELLRFVAGVGIDTDHGEYYDLPLDDFVLRAEGLLWEASRDDAELRPAWAWCFEHSYPGGWRDEDGALAAYLGIPGSREKASRGARDFLRRERKRALKEAFGSLGAACRAKQKEE